MLSGSASAPRSHPPDPPAAAKGEDAKAKEAPPAGKDDKGAKEGGKEPEKPKKPALKADGTPKGDEPP